MRATRFAAANRAPQTGRGAPMVPTLLAARAEGELGPDDEERLTRLLGRSSEARTSADRMRRGEAAYTDPAAALPPRGGRPDGRRARGGRRRSPRRCTSSATVSAGARSRSATPSRPPA